MRWTLKNRNIFTGSTWCTRWSKKVVSRWSLCRHLFFHVFGARWIIFSLSCRQFEWSLGGLVGFFVELILPPHHGFSCDFFCSKIPEYSLAIPEWSPRFPNGRLDSRMVGSAYRPWGKPTIIVSVFLDCSRNEWFNKLSMIILSILILVSRLWCQNIFFMI